MACGRSVASDLSVLLFLARDISSDYTLYLSCVSPELERYSSVQSQAKEYDQRVVYVERSRDAQWAVMGGVT